MRGGSDAHVGTGDSPVQRAKRASFHLALVILSESHSERACGVGYSRYRKAATHYPVFPCVLCVKGSVVARRVLSSMPVGPHPPRAHRLLRLLKIHVLIHRKLRRQTRRVVAGTSSHYTKSALTDLHRVTIRRPLPRNGNVVSRNQCIERDVFPFARKVPPLRRGDTHQIGPYASDVDGCLRRVRSRRSRRTLHLPGIKVHANTQSKHEAEKAKYSAHKSLHRNCTAKPRPWQVTAGHYPVFPLPALSAAEGACPERSRRSLP